MCLSICLHGLISTQKRGSEGGLYTGTRGQVMKRKGELAVHAPVQEHCAELGRLCTAQPKGFHSHHHQVPSRIVHYTACTCMYSGRVVPKTI